MTAILLSIRSQVKRVLAAAAGPQSPISLHLVSGIDIGDPSLVTYTAGDCNFGTTSLSAKTWLRTLYGKEKE